MQHTKGGNGYEKKQALFYLLLLEAFLILVAFMLISQTAWAQFATDVKVNRETFTAPKIIPGDITDGVAIASEGEYAYIAQSSDSGVLANFDDVFFAKNSDHGGSFSDTDGTWTFAQ